MGEQPYKTLERDGWECPSCGDMFSASWDKPPNCPTCYIAKLKATLESERLKNAEQAAEIGRLRGAVEASARGDGVELTRAGASDFLREHRELTGWHRTFFGQSVLPEDARRMVEDRARAEVAAELTRLRAQVAAMEESALSAAATGGGGGR